MTICKDNKPLLFLYHLSDIEKDKMLPVTEKVSIATSERANRNEILERSSSLYELVRWLQIQVRSRTKESTINIKER